MLNEGWSKFHQRCPRVTAQAREARDLRDDQDQLLDKLNAYINRNYRGLFYNVTFNRYFKESKTIRIHEEYRVEAGKEISPYDDLAKEYALKYGFDWRLLVSQMYQESKFNPDAVSFAGAQGLMQVMPRR